MELLQLPKYRGERIHNPFNIDKSHNAWEGKIVGPDKRFESFSSPVYGIRAGVKLLRTYFEKYGLNTINKIFDRYAPPNENNTAEYKQFVANELGVDIDDPIDLRKSAFSLSKAIIHMEQTRVIYPDEMILKGIELAFK